MGYAARLRVDARRWRDLGIIDGSQEARIVALADDGGSGRMQVALVLCAAACAATAAIAFTASNWSQMGAGARLLVLLVGNALAVAGAWWASNRRDARRGHLSAALAEGFSVLSLAVATAATALVGQTFHVAPDPKGFALTVAALGAATAVVTRSGGAALVGCIALSLGALDLQLDILSPRDVATAGGPTFWILAVAYAGLVLTGRARSGAAVSLALLAAVAVGLSGNALRALVDGAGLANLVAVSAAGIGVGQALHRLRPDVPWLSPDAGEALSRGAAGLALASVVLLSQRVGGLDAFLGVSRTTIGLGALAWLALAGALLALPRILGKGAIPAGHATVLGALSLSLAAYLSLRSGAPFPRSASRTLSSVATVWVGVLPCLAMVVAGHIDERRALFWFSILATAGLSVWLLVSSSDLAGLSLNLLGLAVLLGLSVAAARVLSRQPAEATR